MINIDKGTPTFTWRRKAATVALATLALPGCGGDTSTEEVQSTTTTVPAEALRFTPVPCDATNTWHWEAPPITGHETLSVKAKDTAQSLGAIIIHQASVCERDKVQSNGDKLKRSVWADTRPGEAELQVITRIQPSQPNTPDREIEAKVFFGQPVDNARLTSPDRIADVRGIEIINSSPSSQVKPPVWRIDQLDESTYQIGHSDGEDSPYMMYHSQPGNRTDKQQLTLANLKAERNYATAILMATE